MRIHLSSDVAPPDSDPPQTPSTPTATQDSVIPEVRCSMYGAKSTLVKDFEGVTETVTEPTKDVAVPDVDILDVDLGDADAVAAEDVVVVVDVVEVGEAVAPTGEPAAAPEEESAVDVPVAPTVSEAAVTDEDKESSRSSHSEHRRKLPSSEKAHKGSKKLKPRVSVEALGADPQAQELKRVDSTPSAGSAFSEIGESGDMDNTEQVQQDGDGEQGGGKRRSRKLSGARVKEKNKGRSKTAKQDKEHTDKEVDYVEVDHSDGEDNNYAVLD